MLYLSVKNLCFISEYEISVIRSKQNDSDNHFGDLTNDFILFIFDTLCSRLLVEVGIRARAPLAEPDRVEEVLTLAFFIFLKGSS